MMTEIYNEDSDPMMSLFEYLGSPAGSALGARVYEEAVGRGVPVRTRTVRTKTYHGKVMIYPKTFLQEYFKNENTTNTG